MMRLLALAFLLLAQPVAAGEIPPAERRSDTVTMSPELRAMQADDMANPASLWVLDGQALWGARAGRSGTG